MDQGLGYEAEETGNIDDSLGQYDVVVHTVTGAVLGESRLSKLKRGCLCSTLPQNPGHGFFGRVKAGRQGGLGSEPACELAPSPPARLSGIRFIIPEGKGHQIMISKNIGFAFCAPTAPLTGYRRA
jgi:hypothetical protein